MEEKWWERRTNWTERDMNIRVGERTTLQRQQEERRRNSQG